MTDTATSSYRRVAILRPGKFQDEAGRSVEFDPEDLSAIADNYDPQFHAATVNIDHQDHGPALGLVSDLVFDGEHLLADLRQVPFEIVLALSQGRYPYRSAEVYPDLAGKGLYLRAVALLGAKPPAVKGLPPWPSHETRLAERPGSTAFGLAVGPGPTGLSRQPARQPMIFTSMTEVTMTEHSDEHDETQVESSPPEPTLAEPTDHLRLAEDNQRLAEENRRLKHAERERQVACFLSELREMGKLTPAIDQAGIKEALVAVEEQGQVIKLADGSQLPLSQVLQDVLSALPVAVSYGQAAPADTARPLALSPDEQAIAASLGLSDAEYLASQPATAA